MKNEASSPKSILETWWPLPPPTSRLAIQPTTGQPWSKNQLHPSEPRVYGTPPPTVALGCQRSSHPQNRRSAPLQGTFILALLPRENWPKPAVTQGEYVYRVRSQKVASMNSNSGCVLSKIKAVRPSVLRAEGMSDIHNISRELAYRGCMVKRFSQATEGSASHRLVYSARRKLSFAGDAIGGVLAY